MVKEFETTFINTLKELDAKMSNALRSVPLLKGQVLTFTGETSVITTELKDRNGNIVKYGVFRTKEGYDVPFSQIARRNNGLNLKGNTVAEALKEFAARIDGKFSVTVADVKKVESSFGEGKNTYIIFDAPVIEESKAVEE